MITVFGSINVDLVCRVAAIPGPGQTVLGSDYDLIAGGKGANQALAARRAGAEVRLAGAVGADDEMASTALAELRAGGVDLEGVLVRGERTGLAIITVDEAGENTIIVSPGANARAEATSISGFSEGGTLLVQMEVPFEENVTAARAATAAGARTLFSIAPFSPLTPDQLEPFSMILVNEHEAADLAGALGIAGTDPAATVHALAQRLERTVIATLGPDGAVAAGQHGQIHVPAIPVQVVDTTGAGDTFAGTLATFLDEGLDLAAAMRLAAVAGSLACTKNGAQPSFPYRREIDKAARTG